MLEEVDTGDSIIDEDIKIISQQIKNAREDKGLTIEFVSEELKCSISRITELEEGTFNKKKDLVFTRGYLRSYANFLCLNTEDIIERFNRVFHYRNTKLSLIDLKNQNSNNPNISIKSFIVIGLSIFLVFILIYFVGKEFIQSNLVASNKPSSIVIDKDLYNQSDSQNLPEDSYYLSITDDIHSNNLLSDDNNLIKTITDDIHSNNLLSDDNNLIKTDDVKIVNEKFNEYFNLHKEGLGKIDVLFENDSWVNIINGEGKSLMNGIGKGGTILEWVDKTPFTLRFGVANAVKVEFNGVAVDLSRYKKVSGDTVRFKIPEIH